MAKLVVLYKTPADPVAFDAYYMAKHVPLAKQIPGLARYEISTGPVTTPQGPSSYHLAAVLEFDSFEALGAGLGSPEGQAAARDVGNFADAGADLLLFDTKEV
ncbi:MAG: EthD family reductase [Paraburkholderia sp.]|uniref:EthD family reductase n=1 Tax=Paraburkholderia sp. TaxID=1926495 RepID=UPI0011FB0578|nr:EthD family reductase [Paraburkholderia sp.]TAL99727.1 MAG: EthD family reductase [Paraburkholderia sp.]TAM30838.1 MAG: EthD family reductase [Paraburkholderia sp.]